VHYLDFLAQIHARLAPPTYLEIGIRHGHSLALTRSVSVGIDPSYRLQTPLPRDVTLFRETSDEYFERDDPLEALDDRRIGLSFIDGLHLAEFAVRDFVNVERHADWTSVIVFDDIFPADAEMAARDRKTWLWTGDVYKVMAILDDHRPDLIRLRVDTEPTGLLLVLGADPHSTVLADRYETLARAIEVPDPQDVPAAVLERRGAVDPQRVLEAGFWDYLRDAREDPELVRPIGLRRLRRRVRRDLHRARA
jgi:hypothetical protein